LKEKQGEKVKNGYEKQKERGKPRHKRLNERDTFAVKEKATQRKKSDREKPSLLRSPNESG